jgi:acetyl esterase/lipase
MMSAPGFVMACAGAPLEGSALSSSFSQQCSSCATWRRSHFLGRSLWFAEAQHPSIRHAGRKYCVTSVNAPASDPSAASIDQDDMPGGTTASSPTAAAFTSSPDSEDESNGFQTVLDGFVDLVNSTFDTLFGPALSSCSLAQGNWERKEGNFILRPTGRAKAVIHFIGGAFVGAAPHIAYSTLLERLVSRGYCVVATPFDLSLNYLETTSHITERWEAVEMSLALAYGTVPVIGLGHSAGALFHSIASSLFDEASPKAGNILISFNNKSIRDAIPLYDLLVTPAAKQSVVLESAIPESVLEALESVPGTIDAALEGSLLTPQRFKSSVLPLIKDARRVADAAAH